MLNEQTEGALLRDATFASLTGHALTPHARALVEDINGQVVTHLERSEAKPGTKKTNRKKLRIATEAFIADLLTANAGKRPRKWVYRALTERGFTGGPVSYDAFRALQNALHELGLVEYRPGVGQWGKSFEQELAPGDKTRLLRRWAPRFCATPALLKISKRHNVPPSDAFEHFGYGLPEHPLRKHKASTKDPYTRDKVRGTPMKFTHTLRSRRIEDDVRELNEFLDKQKLEGGVHQGYVRIFNNGDGPNFNWDQGGRLYSQPSGKANYQQLPGKERRKMTINGEAVAEVDLRASFLTIFHAWHGVQLDRDADPYALSKLGSEAMARDAVKLWSVAAFGSGGPLKRWPSELVKGYDEDHPGHPLDRKKYNVRRIGELMVSKYPLLAKLGEPIAGRAGTWADLQFEESVVIVGTMLRLMRDHEIPAYAVHDSLVVSSSNADLTANKLKESFTAHLGTIPLIKINPPIRRAGEPRNT